MSATMYFNHISLNILINLSSHSDYLNHDLYVCTIALTFLLLFCVLCFTAVVCQLFLIN